MSDGCGRLALCAYDENSPRPGGRYRRAGRVAVYLPGGGRNRLADHDRHHALQGLAAVRRSDDQSARNHLPNDLQPSRALDVNHANIKHTAMHICLAPNCGAKADNSGPPRRNMY